MTTLSVQLDALPAPVVEKTSTRARRKACKHAVLTRPPRALTFVRCDDCGDRFPCRDCEHEDCVEARAAGAIENWPVWVRVEWFRP